MAMMTGQGIVLYLGVTPLQLESLRRGYEITPDQHSRRFGLRSGPHGAIERAHYFMNWSPEGNLGICSIEEMKAVKVFISGLGYLRKYEGGVLEWTQRDEYRCYGSISRGEFDSEGRELYRVEEIDMVSLSHWQVRGRD